MVLLQATDFPTHTIQPRVSTYGYFALVQEEVGVPLSVVAQKGCPKDVLGFAVGVEPLHSKLICMIVSKDTPKTVLENVRFHAPCFCVQSFWRTSLNRMHAHP